MAPFKQMTITSMSLNGHDSNLIISVDNRLAFRHNSIVIDMEQVVFLFAVPGHLILLPAEKKRIVWVVGALSAMQVVVHCASLSLHNSAERGIDTRAIVMTGTVEET